MWGTDQSASVGPQGVARLVRDIRIVESAMGDGIKKVYVSEINVMQKSEAIADHLINFDIPLHQKRQH